jgi:hypothetical protein
MILEEIYNINQYNMTSNVDSITSIGAAGLLSLPFRYVRQQYQKRRQPPYLTHIVASFSARRFIPSYSDLFSQSNYGDDELDVF